MDQEKEQKTNPEEGQDVVKKPKRWKLLTNKYIIALLVFVAWMTIFDQHNIFSQMKKRAELQRMNEKREYYKNEIMTNDELIKGLLYDRDELERYGREEFLMKRGNEDIFLIIPKDADQ
mgnify:CR=1 FL=1